MFARNPFPTSQALTCDDDLAGMAHAMGCGTHVEPALLQAAVAAGAVVHDRMVEGAVLTGAALVSAATAKP